MLRVRWYSTENSRVALMPTSQVRLGAAEGRISQTVIVRAGRRFAKPSRMAESSIEEIQSRFMGFWQPANS